MHRFFIVLGLITLVACTGQGGNGTDRSPGSAVSTPVSSPAPTDGASGRASAECAESFSAIEEMDVSSITELGDLQDETEATVESCESLDEWVAAAGQALGDDINPNTAALLLSMRCGDPSLSNTPICEELASS